MQQKEENTKGEKTRDPQEDEAVQRGKMAIEGARIAAGNVDKKKQEEEESRDAEKWRNEG
jgi:hypothetical protein